MSITVINTLEVINIKNHQEHLAVSNLIFRGQSLLADGENRITVGVISEPDRRTRTVQEYSTLSPLDIIDDDSLTIKLFIPLAIAVHNASN